MIECSICGVPRGLVPREAIYSRVFKTLDSYDMPALSLSRKKHEIENVSSVSDHISRCSIACDDRVSVRSKSSCRTRPPSDRPGERGMHLHPSNIASQPGITQRHRRTC